jgi:hypothetical protein
MTLDLSITDKAAAERFVANALQAVEQATCDRAVLIIAFLSVAAELAVLDATLRPELLPVYAVGFKDVAAAVARPSSPQLPRVDGRTH